MTQEDIKHYSLKLLTKCFKLEEISADELLCPEVQSIALSETEDSVEDCEEIGSSDSHYHRQSILYALGKPSIYSKEKNKYNEMFRR
jgi:hypothetical protein|tara:strand:- start:1456 stop:1716 length:261 start_codon:yes stop_codon:yes gene_type:complete